MRLSINWRNSAPHSAGAKGDEMTNNDKVKKLLQAIAEEVGLTPLEVARAILSWEEATADDPAAADRLRLLREINPTFQPMDN
jgi:hypothetical protein